MTMHKYVMCMPPEAIKTTDRFLSCHAHGLGVAAFISDKPLSTSWPFFLQPFRLGLMILQRRCLASRPPPLHQANSQFPVHLAARSPAIALLRVAPPPLLSIYRSCNFVIFLSMINEKGKLVRVPSLKTAFKDTKEKLSHNDVA